MSVPASGRADLPQQHDCEHCAFCQFAARISHSPPMPVIVPALLRLDYVLVVYPPDYIPADIAHAVNARGPPISTLPIQLTFRTRA